MVFHSLPPSLVCRDLFPRDGNGAFPEAGTEPSPKRERCLPRSRNGAVPETGTMLSSKRERCFPRGGWGESPISSLKTYVFVEKTHRNGKNSAFSLAVSQIALTFATNPLGKVFPLRVESTFDVKHLRILFPS